MVQYQVNERQCNVLLTSGAVTLCLERSEDMLSVFEKMETPVEIRRCSPRLDVPWPDMGHDGDAEYSIYWAYVPFWLLLLIIGTPTGLLF
jgi:hypothetical protein